MDLKEEMKKAELYSEVRNNLVEEICKYADLYNDFSVKYSKKIDSLKDDFENFFRENEFNIMTYTGSPSTDSKLNDIMAQYKGVEFKLSIYDDGNKNISFWKSKPQNDSIYVEVKLTVDEYRINLEFNQNRICSINDLTNIKQNTMVCKFTVDEMEHMCKVICEECSNVLAKETEKLNKSTFVGEQKEKGKVIQTIEFASIEQLMKKL